MLGHGTNKSAGVMMNFQVGAICAVVNVMHHLADLWMQPAMEGMPEVAPDGPKTG